MSVLIPCYNEHSVLPLLFARMNEFIDTMPEYDWEIMMVNDGSSDDSMSQIIHMHIRDKRWQFV
ncbi:MAG: glycosyltransferase, partial [Muribaculaceae bacterium]|nr:glycosyltransferase [Muribaculaceae bacterium]